MQREEPASETPSSGSSQASQPSEPPGGSTFASMVGDSPATIDSAPAIVRARTVPAPYEIVRPLGAGGMGEVFAARHIHTQELVALKLLSTTTATRLYRFKREFRALVDVTHRNLVRLGELVVPESGAAYFTMELIDGRPFVDWVRESTPIGSLPNLDRLVLALRQLAEAVSSLHDLGFVHRDLKPANVLVTHDGRVVVLDFGLVSEISDVDAGITREQQVLGTPSYMAPEQTVADRAGPAADFYAIGVMLYECMTGLLPHRGPAVQLLVDKQVKATPDPADEVADAPEWLRSLCVRLLARNSDARPSGRELLASLEITKERELVPPEIFVGRERELAELHGALQSTVELGAPVIVHLRAHSGHGKSALVRQWRSQLRGTEATVLHGRCGENETIPYKGVDAIVDHLSAILRHLPPAERAELRPTELGPLAAVFPVLDDIWSHAERPVGYSLDEIRRIGTASLRELLVRMSRRRPIVVHIDDFHWADLDSVTLLKSVLRPPDAPVMMLVLAYRSTSELEILRELASDPVLGTASARIIELGQLSSAEARELASGLLRSERAGQHGLSYAAESIAVRSRGSPLFIIQTILGGQDVDSDSSDIDRLVASRLDGLDPTARGLLDTVAVFGGPLPVELALELQPDATEATVAALCDQGLLERDAAGIETAHDRVREVALAQLDPKARRRRHWEIGERLRAALAEGEVDRIYVVANHLDAGVEDIDDLPLVVRMQLVELNLHAGQRALQSTAWVAAHRYLEYAHRLVAPFLTEARQGQGPYQLCLATVFGYCQVASFLDREGADELVDDLLGWSLSMSDYCRIAQWYCEAQVVKARFAKVMAFGVPALERIGFPVPRRPSWPRALFSFFRGWRAIWNIGLEQIMAKPTEADPHVRAGLEVAAMTSASAGFAGPRSLLATMGAYSMMLTRYGLHDWAALALAGFTFSAVALGKDDQARELIQRTENFLDMRSTSAPAHTTAQAVLMLVTPSVFPVAHVTARGEDAYARVRDSGQRVLIQSIGMVCLFSYVLQGTSISNILTFAAAFKTDVRVMYVEVVAQLDDVVLSSRALVEGLTTLDLDRELHPSLSPMQRGAMLTFRIMAAATLGDREGAWRLIEDLARDFPQDLTLMWPTALYITLSVVVMAERSATCGARERRRMLRRIRKHRAAAARWSRRCPETYQPMLELIDAELAGLANRWPEATSAFERACAGAAANQMTWLRGLASERLAKLAVAQGHPMLADGAFNAAHDAYEAWGATAVVARLDRDRKALATRS